LTALTDVIKEAAVRDGGKGRSTSTEMAGAIIMGAAREAADGR
jgi:hypothetical protein